jgi:hypothetical protein
MTTNTVALQRFFAVKSCEREPCVDVVVKGRLPFTRLDVTTRTIPIFVLAFMRLFVGVAARTSPFSVLNFDLWFMTTVAPFFFVLTEQRKTEFSVIDMRALEGAPRGMATRTVGHPFSYRVARRMATRASLRNRSPGNVVLPRSTMAI